MKINKTENKKNKWVVYFSSGVQEEEKEEEKSAGLIG